MHFLKSCRQYTGLSFMSVTCPQTSYLIRISVVRIKSTRLFSWQFFTVAFMTLTMSRKVICGMARSSPYEYMGIWPEDLHNHWTVTAVSLQDLVKVRALLIPEYACTQDPPVQQQQQKQRSSIFRDTPTQVHQHHPAKNCIIARARSRLAPQLGQLAVQALGGGTYTPASFLREGDKPRHPLASMRSPCRVSSKSAAPPESAHLAE